MRRIFAAQKNKGMTLSNNNTTVRNRFNSNRSRTMFGKAPGNTWKSKLRATV